MVLFQKNEYPPLAFIGIYFLSGLISSLLSDISTLNKPVVSCGASGAIIGIITALLAYSLVFKTDFQEMPIKAMLISLALTTGIGLFPSVNNIAHLTGAIAGFALGILVSVLHKIILLSKQSQHSNYQYVICCYWIWHLFRIFRF